MVFISPIKYSVPSLSPMILNLPFKTRCFTKLFETLLCGRNFYNQNRVVSLRFLKNGSNDFYRHCNQAIWIHFEYPDNQTVKVWFLDKQGKALVDLRCRLPRSKTYHLSTDHRSILSCEADYKMDEEQYKKIGWPKAFVDQMANSKSLGIK